ncbi:MAG: sugar ABC transporter substrate-binding protein, partial [Flavobacteriaceae bacterium]|nr:sugar ABC transporter substrate-binding protein [Flavobacteriaceae bacterium]
DQQQYLQGYMPIVVLTQMAKYGVLQSGDINSGPGYVTKANVSNVEKYAGKYR